MRIPILICTVSLAAAAVDLDINLAALRDQAPALRAAMPAVLRTRFDAAAEAVRSESGTDPRTSAQRLHLSLDDDRRTGLVLIGVPAEALRQRIVAQRPQANPVVLAADILAVGLAGAPVPRAVPPSGSFAVTLHATPMPDPALPIMRHITALDASADGAGHIRATVSTPSADDAIAVEARLAALRDHPPFLLPAAARAVLSGIGVQRYDSVVHVAVDIPEATRQTWLRLACERIAARMGQAD